MPSLAGMTWLARRMVLCKPCQILPFAESNDLDFGLEGVT